MGELILCNESIAKIPYFIEDMSINVYSLEELCYYIENNSYLLESDFVNESLITWIEKEANYPELADSLRKIVRKNGRLSRCVRAILVASGYCSQTQVLDLSDVISEMEEKSDFECRKIRADHLLEKEKYLNSIYEYKRLLDSEDKTKSNHIMLGSIWHNLGTAYARLFLFEEAKQCYKKAYGLNQNMESLKACLFTFRCLHDEIGFMKFTREYSLSDEIVHEISSELSQASRSEVIQEFEEDLEQLIQRKEIGERKESQDEILDIIYKWKEDYRRICKV